MSEGMLLLRYLYFDLRLYFYLYLYPVHFSEAKKPKIQGADNKDGRGDLHGRHFEEGAGERWGMLVLFGKPEKFLMINC